MARTLRRALAAACGALLLGGLILAGGPAAAGSPAAPQGEGLAWRLRGPGGGTVYLVGSMHLLRAGDAALPEAFDRAYAEAERLVMEIDVDDVDPAAAAAFTRTHASFAPGTSLREALGGRRWRRARAAFQRLGLRIEALDGLEPWAVALLYSVSSMADLGFEPGLGVEEQLKARAVADRKPIEGLETVEDQLGLFDALAPADQARFLDLALDDAAGAARELDVLTRAWREGDARALSRLLLREYRRFPSLYEPLVHGRNRSWIPRIEQLLAGGDDALVVVGALHLVGEQGLVALLRERGLAFEPYRPH
ncbi:MAG: TraB/GumN family protein [Steroidobacteraceae bacterium]|nr:TraB/GumN family protein [Steroidobacteraceae bacterium]